MADYKVVDVQQLDADLGTVADAIRTRGGTTEPLSFPDGMVEAVADIPDYEDTLALLLAGDITEIASDKVTYLGQAALANRRKLVTVSFPNLVSASSAVFQNCVSLVSIYLPKLKTAGNNSFQGIAATTVDLPSMESLNNGLFQYAAKLEALILRRTAGVVTLAGTGAFQSTKIESGTGCIYVPSALVDSYKTATNWSTFADQIRAIEDYPEITGGATA